MCFLRGGWWISHHVTTGQQRAFRCPLAQDALLLEIADLFLVGLDGPKLQFQDGLSDTRPDGLLGGALDPERTLLRGRGTKDLPIEFPEGKVGKTIAKENKDLKY